jgi:protein-disulfide isomerase
MPFRNQAFGGGWKNWVGASCESSAPAGADNNQFTGRRGNDPIFMAKQLSQSSDQANRKGPRRMKSKLRNVWIGAAALAIVVAAAAFFLTDHGATSVSLAQAMDLNAEQALPDIVLGDENAPVTIIEYASMTCPHCANFNNNTLPVIKEKYIDTGKVKLILREFPFDPRAVAAAMLARCAAPEHHYALIDVLFKRQREWAQAPDPRPVLLQIARFAGFSQETFEACLKSQELLDNVRKVQEKGADDYGVESTPTLFINGDKHTGALSPDELSKIIDSKL